MYALQGYSDESRTLNTVLQIETKLQDDPLEKTE
jgi:hypothetical protein